MSSERGYEQKKGITRRQFLKGGTAAAVTLASGGLLAGCGDSSKKSTKENSTATNNEKKWSFETPPAKIKDSQIKKKITTDVVVVGAGMAGMCAAYAAMEAGAKVAVIEKQKDYTVRGMAIAAIGTRIQKKKKVKIDYVQGIRDIIRWSAGGVKQDLWWLWAKESGPAFDWLLDMTEAEGITADLWAAGYRGKDFYEYPGITHMFTGPNFQKFDNNRDFMEILYKNGKQKGIDFHFNTKAKQLVRPDNKGRVTGVIAKGKDGYIQFNANKGVILCCGDYGADKEMIERYCPQAKVVDGTVYTPEGINTGDGHKMGLWVGAAMQKSEPHAAMIHTQLGANSYCFLHVNKNGERYSNEDATPQVVCNTKVLQPGGIAWAVYDSKFIDEIPKTLEEGGGMFWDQINRLWGQPFNKEQEKASLERYMKSGLVVKADTIEELANKMEVPAENLKATVKRYNELAKKGKDEDFHKNPKMLFPIENPPFYAGRFKSALLVTLGGLRINSKMQVLDKNDEPIEGLYAAGNNAGDFFAEDYPTIFPGVSISRCITFGRLAGQNAANEA